MKQLWVFAVLMLGLAGCVTPPSAPLVGAMRSGAPAAPVRADDVTPENAGQIARALADELDREAQHAVTAPAAANR